jgi:hypothetical protein
MKFKIGEKVQVKKEGPVRGSRGNGYIGIVTSRYPDDDNLGLDKNSVYYLDYGNGSYEEDLIELTNNKTMNIKEKFILALTKEPQKSFRKVGLTNGDDILTEDGQKIFLSWLLHSKFAEEFKTAVVDDMVKDLEKEVSK